MEQTLQRAHELADQKADFVITSTHETASGHTEITVRRYPPTVLILACTAILLRHLQNQGGATSSLPVW